MAYQLPSPKKKWIQPNKGDSFGNLWSTFNMDFDVMPLATMIAAIEPEWVNIGADSQGHKLPEPDTDKIEDLMEKLRTFTKVIPKDNLKRLYK